MGWADRPPEWVCSGRRAPRDLPREWQTADPRYRDAVCGQTALLRGQLHQLAHIHDGDTVTNILDSRQTMGDEDVGEMQFLSVGLSADSESVPGWTRPGQTPVRRR